jgi:uncharacterized protein (TIGR04255 family)
MSGQRPEVYPNAPVVLVALEVRHTGAEALTAGDRKLVKQRLSEHAPIMRVQQQQTVTFVQAGAAEPIQEARLEEYPRYLSRDKTTAVTVRSDVLVVETTQYGQWERLRAVAAAAFSARQEVGGIDGVERIGLRYVDEIRVPEPESGWAPWVDRALLGASAVGEEVGLTSVQWQAATAFAHGPESGVVLRYGPREGFAVDPNGELKRSTFNPGPFFLIDIDSFWTPAGAVPEFETEALLATSDDLHTPVRGLFERLITEKLREEVFRRVP